MVGEGNFVEVIVRIVRVESGEPAVFRLHAVHPVGRALHCALIAGPSDLLHGPAHRGRVVDVGIMAVAELERPAAATQAGAGLAPVAGRVKQLARLQPVQRAQHLFADHTPAGFVQRQAGQRRVPHGRDAGLAVGIVLAHHEQPLQRFPGLYTIRVIGGIAEQSQRLVGVHHGRENGAQSVDTVEPLYHPRLGFFHGMAAHPIRDGRLEQLADAFQPEQRAVDS